MSTEGDLPHTAGIADIRRKYRTPADVEQLRGADASRERLLRAAHELLIETRGAEPSVSQICGRAGLRSGMVSYCFGGKAALLDALLYRATESVMAEVKQLAASQLSPTDKLRRHIRGMVMSFVRYPYTQNISERLAAAGDSIRPITERFATPTLEFYRSLVVEGVAAGEFRADLEPNFLFVSTAGMCEFLFAAKDWLPLAGQEFDQELMERFAEHCTRLLLGGIAAPIH